ncbi:MAG: adenosylcobalamin-dependent ribonucleoside-diphosphate reductase [Candidatus Daviesbacteria bacterium]|nr:adenosylcobalamin-dependent ribonucleoside-diphosphate reductase [Candidatus Daviesbacteria bacterium]
MIKKEKPVLQIVSMPQVGSHKKSNGVHTNRHANPEETGVFIKAVMPAFVTNPTVLDGMRSKVFLDRYSMKDVNGEPMEKHPEEMWWRVANGIAHEEKTPELRKHWAKKFYEAMDGFKFVPGGRILSGAGTGFEVTFFNCYVIPSPKDSRGGIMENITHTVEIQARGGGVGINLSSLRPHGARVKKVNGTSSGPVSWAALYSAANHDVIQQGGSRRGALMLMLHDWHPDVIEFIHVKEDLTKIPGANLSICVSDKFMEAVQKDEEWTTKFPDITDPDYDSVWDGDIEKWESLGKKVITYGTYKAKDIWDQICNAAWRSAEPGLHFLERSNKWSNTWYFEKLLSTNPCGEQPLGAWAVCNLGAMNLAAFVDDSGNFDYPLLEDTTKTAMRFMDNVVDANYYFYDENEKRAKEIRRTGIGSMGLGDALIKMKIRYGSDASLEVMEKIYKTIRDVGYETSSDLAKEKGPFPKFEAKKYLQGHFIQDLPEAIQKKIKTQGIRNAVILTQAPTGTTSLLSGVSSGIEPVYDFAFVRTDRTGTSTIYHPLYKAWRDANPEAEVVPDYFCSANDLTPEDHVKVQATVQRYTDSSISKTVNAPNAHTVDDVKKLYMMAYELGCKGVTYFRDGSRTGVLAHIENQPAGSQGKKEEKVEETAEVFVSRPMILRGRTYRMQTPLGEAFVTINRDAQNQPFEVFVTIGKGGMHTMADAEAIGRLASLSLRLARSSGGLSPKEVAQKIVSQLRGIGGASHVGFGKDRVMSLADAIAKTLSEDLAVNETEEPMEQVPLNLPEGGKDDQDKTEQLKLGVTAKQGDLCPECGAASFVMEEGCQKCYSCGYSKC